MPKSGRARVIVMTDNLEDKQWQTGIYEQFLRDD
jgi:hypothetical protein